MNSCKRMTVTAKGITKDRKVYSARNYNESECLNIAGACGCIHAEDALLRDHKDIEIIIVSHSPCLYCAKLIASHGIKMVLYKEEYRIKDGINYLIDNNVTVIKI